METAHAYMRLVDMLEEAGLSPTSMSPWPAWKIFKRFLREPLDDAASDALVQIGSYPDPVGYRIHLYFVRQFSDVLAHDSAAHDKQFAHLVCDLAFADRIARIRKDREWWSQDFRARGAFIDAVETDPIFQALMSGEPLETGVYWEQA